MAKRNKPIVQDPAIVWFPGRIAARELRAEPLVMDGGLVLAFKDRDESVVGLIELFGTRILDHLKAA